MDATRHARPCHSQLTSQPCRIPDSVRQPTSRPQDHETSLSQSSQDSPQGLDRLSSFHPIYTRELLLEAAEVVEKVRQNENGELADPLFALDIYDKPHEIFPFSHDDPVKVVEEEKEQGKKKGIELSWLNYSGMAKRPAPIFHLRQRGAESVAACRTLTTSTPDTNPPPASEMTEDEQELLRKVEQLESTWPSSPQCKQLEEKLAVFKSTTRVKNIVCFALGSLFDFSTEPKQDLEPAHQHIVACFLARHLQTMYAAESGENAEPIPILAYDPAYTVADLAILARLNPPIRIVSDPHHYLAIDANTLVMSVFHPLSVPIFDIIADVTYVSGGPAAFFCNELVDDYVSSEGWVYLTKMCSLRGLKMWDRYERIKLTELWNGINETSWLWGVGIYVRENVGEVR